MTFHPDVLNYFASVASEFPPPGTEPTAQASRALHQRLARRLGVGRALQTVRTFTVPGPTGEIACRLYSDRPPGSLPLLIFLHGGGWIGGDLDTHDVFCRELAFGADCGVIAVDYRLAPENKFPGGYEDCLAACTYILAHAAELGIDPARIAIGGDSAGGNLAAAVVQALRQAEGKQPCFQLLIYPFTDFRMATPAFTEMQVPGFSAREAAWCVDQYLSSISEARDLRASPALAGSLSGLPPTFVVTAEFDVLRDDGEAYALALAKAGVPVQVRRYLGVPHGFLAMPPDLEVTASAIGDVCKALRAAFEEKAA
ncbi:MAG TPA: alpha/beta hydrolase [Steroidobacteraceae bacterium]|nr:alpha/beta hydrolase [Steroidobacteraceae bacterium]